jgi:HEPN domain-containing protein
VGQDAVAEGRRWLEQAKADRHGAQLLYDGASYHLACFVAQHVAQTAIKAFLYARGEEAVIGRSVEALARWAAEYDPEFERLREAAAPLDGYYIPTRYPSGLPGSIPARVYTEVAARETLRMADLVLEGVDERLQGAGRE